MEEQEKIFLGYEITKIKTSRNLIENVKNLLVDVDDVDEIYDQLAEIEVSLLDMESEKELKMERLCQGWLERIGWKNERKALVAVMLLPYWV